MRSALAQFISYALNPLIILIVLPFILVYKSTGDFIVSVLWTGYTVFFLLSIVVFILWGVHKKVFSNMDVSRREQRPLLFYFLLLICALYLLGLFSLSAPRILFIVTINILIGILIVSAINMKIKASIHVATISAFILGIALGYGGPFLLLLILVPVMGWSRVKLRRHTISETVVGGIVGSLLLLGIYGFYQAIIIR